MSMMSRWIEEYEGYKRCRQIVVTGFHGIWEAHKNVDFKAVLNSADLWVPDGIAPVWVARHRGYPDAQRTPGADIMEAFFEQSNERGYSSFFYGDTDDTLIALRENVQRKYPGHNVTGTFSPPFRPTTPEEDDIHVRMINDARPDVLWVGLGLPKQERWIFEHKDRLNVPIAIGVGAAFRFISGKVQRAPEWIARSGFEWVWRLIKEPRKLWRRNLLDVPRFVTLAFLETMRLRKYDQSIGEGSQN
jgi:N-acetylglucosaminyldiphosphoundecaprenol N-acetyl-beta-D-mannosaminyltransferase